MKKRNKNHKSLADGFTMGEMVIVIGIIAILAALLAPLAVNRITAARYETCREEVKLIKQAIVGDPALIEGGARSSFGFVGDLGVLPANLAELVVRDALIRPIYQQFGATAMFYGWRGPYISETLDPWGRAYNYSLINPTGDDKRIALIWSSGADGDTALDPLDDLDTRNTDNVLISISQDEAFAMISGNTLDECDAASAFTNISVSYPNGTITIQTTPNKITTVINPVYAIFENETSTTLGIPIGIRLITFTTPSPAAVTALIQVNNGPMVTKNLKAPGACN
jgi:general secretion pathway protein G